MTLRRKATRFATRFTTRAPALLRTREAIVWTALTGLGLYLVALGLSPLAPVLLGFGLMVTFTGLALLVSVLQRLAFRVETPGEGLVEIDEGRISYFGPRAGGSVGLTALLRVEIASRPHLLTDSGFAWILTAEDGSRLVIPLGAAGADRLPDALSPLPGLHLAAGAAALAGNRPGTTLIWERSQPRFGRVVGG